MRKHDGAPKMQFVDAGDPRGEPVLFIHGFMSSNLQWELNTPRLGEHLRTILLELPGHGSSPTPADASGLSPSVVLDEIERIRRELEIERWWVIGHSFGGAVAMRWGLAEPDRTRGIVFTNSRATFGIDRAPQRATNPTATPSNTGASAPRDLRALPFHPIHAKRFPSELKDRMVDVADEMSPDIIDLVGQNSRLWRSRDELADLTVPVLLVNGRWEKAFQRHADEAESLIADLRRVDLDGGHSINIEQPDAFDRAVLEFVGVSRNLADV